TSSTQQQATTSRPCSSTPQPRPPPDYASRRLGHRLAGVRGIYSHVTEPMITTVVDALQRRWETNQPDRTVDTVRRLRAVA
ncbi:hypothetical protein KBX08_32570, partial [Micromonospora sp. H61]|nr:hypothetical protein [Micromonospora sp. H61]